MLSTAVHGCGAIPRNPAVMRSMSAGNRGWGLLKLTRSIFTRLIDLHSPLHGSSASAIRPRTVIRLERIFGVFH